MLRHQKSWILSITLFIGIYLGLYWLYLQIPDDLLEVWGYNFAITTPCVSLIQLFSPGDPARAVGAQILGGSSSLGIVRGCDGVGVYFLLIAAIISLPGTRVRLLLGLLSATAFVYSLNLARILVLYFVIEPHSAWFTSVHDYIFPTLFILAAVAYFLMWAGPINEPDRTA